MSLSFAPGLASPSTTRRWGVALLALSLGACGGGESGGGTGGASAQSGGATSESGGDGGSDASGGSSTGAQSASGGSDAGGGAEAFSGGTSGSGGGTSGSGGGGEVVEQEVAFVVEPTFEGNDNPFVPQAGILRLETDVPALVSVTVEGGGEEWIVELSAATVFEAPIVGLLPATEYTLNLSASAGVNTLSAGPLTWTTPALPTNFPTIQVSVSEADKMEPGMTLFNARMSNGMPLVVTDHAGGVRWYYWDPNGTVREDSRRLSNGHFLFNTSDCEIREVDVLGATVTSFYPSKHPVGCSPAAGSVPVAVDTFHHEFSRPDALGGNYLTLTTEMRTIENYPSSEDNANAAPQSASVVGGVIVEFAPDGSIVKYLPLMDITDPTRIGRDSTSSNTSVTDVYGTVPRDWDHANALIYEESSDCYYVSQRHQDAILKINRTSGELIWILGTPANWKAPYSDKLLTPVGDLTWHYHQHAVEITPLGIGLYDNGNYRASAYESPGAQWGRAVIYAVDEEAMTVSEAWSYGSPAGADFFYSGAMGDSDYQPLTGNVLFVNADSAEIVEVTQEGQRVFELSVSSGAMGFGGVTIYRADRIADLRANQGNLSLPQ